MSGWPLCLDVAFSAVTVRTAHFAVIRGRMSALAPRRDMVTLHFFVTRFMVVITAKQTGILSNWGFHFVPAPPSGRFDHIYTAQELYQAFKLPQNYIDIIEAVIKERK